MSAKCGSFILESHLGGSGSGEYSEVIVGTAWPG